MFGKSKSNPTGTKYQFKVDWNFPILDIIIIGLFIPVISRVKMLFVRAMQAMTTSLLCQNMWKYLLL